MRTVQTYDQLLTISGVRQWRLIVVIGRFFTASATVWLVLTTSVVERRLEWNWSGGAQYVRDSLVSVLGENPL